ncbi:MAG: hypothetical protein HPY52_07730 [Firmicutes bacterium]|nr:hypothetical protein [Bacillota bacterium]
MANEDQVLLRELEMEELDLSELNDLAELCYTLDAGCGALIWCGGCC